MGPKPVVKAKAPIVKAPVPAKKTAFKPATPAKEEKNEKKGKKEKKQKSDEPSTLETGRAQLDAGLAAGRAQLDAGVAAFGSAASNATEALQGWWGGLQIPNITGVAGNQQSDAPKKKNEKPTPAQPAAPVKASPVTPAPATTAMSSSAPPPSKGGYFGIFKSTKGSTPSESGSVDITQPRQRAPGKPPCASVEELRKEMEQGKAVPVDRDESVLIAKRDSLLKTHPGSRIMEFNELRPLSVKVHPSVAPRQMADDPRNTSIMSEIVGDPGLISKQSGVEKVFQSRQFIEAMRRSVNSSKTNSENRPIADSRYLKPIAPDRPLSPMQDHISTITFLPTPAAVCQKCGLYLSSCLCETLKQSSRYNPPNHDVLDRLLARMNQGRDDPDDERVTTNSVRSMNLTRGPGGRP
jgi:hypothetical protein